MRPLWKGSIVLGQVGIPVSLLKSAEHADVSFRSLHSKCGNPLTQDRRCASCDEVIGGGYEETTRGFEFSAGQFVTVTNSELEQALGAKELLLDRFVPASLVKTAYVDTTYWVAPAPDPLAARAYDGLLRSLQGTGMAGLTRLAFFSKERVAAVWPVEHEGDRVLGLSIVYRLDELRAPTEILDTLRGLAGAQATDKEVELFGKAIENRVGTTFRWAQLGRLYPQRIRQLVDAKLAGGESIVAPAPAMVVAPRDLEAALKRSVGKAKRSRVPARTG